MRSGLLWLAVGAAACDHGVPPPTDQDPVEAAIEYLSSSIENIPSFGTEFKEVKIPDASQSPSSFGVGMEMPSFFRSSFQSSSSWWLGGDGKMHHEVHQRESESFDNGQVVRSSQTEVGCLDGSCRQQASKGVRASPMELIPRLRSAAAGVWGAPAPAASSGADGSFSGLWDLLSSIAETPLPDAASLDARVGPLEVSARFQGGAQPPTAEEALPHPPVLQELLAGMSAGVPVAAPELQAEQSSVSGAGGSDPGNLGMSVISLRVPPPALRGAPAQQLPTLQTPQPTLLSPSVAGVQAPRAALMLPVLAVAAFANFVAVMVALFRRFSDAPPASSALAQPLAAPEGETGPSGPAARKSDDSLRLRQVVAKSYLESLYAEVTMPTKAYLARVYDKALASQ